VNHDLSSWQTGAQNRLRELFGNGRGGSADERRIPGVEPTVLACLALLAAGPQPATSETWELVDANANWLAALQHAEGAMPSSADQTTVTCQPTAAAALLWSQLPHQNRPLARALRWLLQQATFASPSSDDEILDRGVTLGGWPWFEPSGCWQAATTFTLVALGRSQLAGHPRAADGVQWILNQEITGGGWRNESATEDHPQHAAHVGATGMLLLALRAAGWMETEEVTRAVDYLTGHLPGVLVPEDLGWGLLGLAAWRTLPAGSLQWLSHSFAHTPAAMDSPRQLALLLLASAASHALGLLGVPVECDVDWSQYRLLRV
jgi:hypothetical protein